MHLNLINHSLLNLNNDFLSEGHNGANVLQNTLIQ